MKILMICKVSPLHSFGTEIRAREVARQMVANGHDVTVICAKGKADEPSEQMWNGVRIIARRVMPDSVLRRFPVPHYLIFAASSAVLALHVLRFLSSNRFDLIREDIAPVPSSGLLSLVRLPFARRTVVVQLFAETLRRGIDLYGVFYGPMTYMFGVLLRKGWLRYDRILAVSPYWTEILAASTAIRDRVSFSPNGVDLERFGGAARIRVAPRQIRKLLNVGRLTTTKGQRFLIEAIANLKDRYPDITLDVYGEGSLEAELRAQAIKMGVAGQIRFFATVAHAEMPGVFADHDAFVMPSLFEGFSLALIEALASGIPVVATAIPAHTSILVSDEALWCDVGKAESLTRALTQLIENPEAAKARALRAIALARSFDWHSIFAQEIKE